MAWRLAIKRKKPPTGWELIEPKLEEFEDRMREAMNEPVENKMRSEVTWCVHRIHYEKNRYLFDLYHVEHGITKKLYDYLIDMKIADGPLMAKWKKPGYETLCSVAVIAKSNTNFRTSGICRVPLRERHGQVTPNVMTGCVSCASGDGGPIWWNDPIPEIVLKRRREALIEEEESSIDPARLKALKGNRSDPPLEEATTRLDVQDAGAQSGEMNNEESVFGQRLEALKTENDALLQKTDADDDDDEEPVGPKPLVDKSPEHGPAPSPANNS